MKKFLMLVAIAMLGLCALTGCHDGKLAKAVKPLAEEAIQKVFDRDAKCKKVKITGKIDDVKYNYKAVAKMADGKEYELFVKEFDDSSVLVDVALLVKLQREAQPLVDQLIYDRVGASGAKCWDVTILKKIGENRYKAFARLDNMKNIDITIEDLGAAVNVQLDL